MTLLRVETFLLRIDGLKCLYATHRQRLRAARKLEGTLPLVRGKMAEKALKREESKAQSK